MKYVIAFVVLVLLCSSVSAQTPVKFSKVGDSITYSWAYLFDFASDYNLGPYSYLQAALDYYAPESFLINPPIAAHPGWTSGDLLLEGNAKVGGCGDLSPLVCAYYVESPSIALILVGTNDVAQHVPLDVYGANMARIVDITIEMGITPVLITIPPFEGKDVQPYNERVRALAANHAIPLIDYYAVFPDSGMSRDGVHPSESPDKKDAYFDVDHLHYGYNVLNLHILKTLYRLMDER